MTETLTNRYAKDWNGYSAEWQGLHGGRYAHLGDEWCDDGTAARVREQRLFAHNVEPWLYPSARVLEIGPGGGKWSVQLASRVGQLTVFDVAEAMLERTRARCDAAGLSNVSYVLGNGRDMAPVPSASLDIVFSYDVFVHIALEDTVAYITEIARILRDGGMAVIHHAVNDVAAASDRIEVHNDWYRSGQTLGQYYYHGHDAIDRMYSRVGLRIKSRWTDYCTTLLVVEKPADSVVPWLEQVLRQAAASTDEATLQQAASAVQALGHELNGRIGQLARVLGETKPGGERYDVVQKIRRLVRG